MSTASPGLHQTVLGAISSHSPGRQTHRDNSNQDSYDQIARSLRKALRDDDVEMEDASGWPANWESEGEGDVEAECGKTGVIQQMSGHVPHLDKTNAREPRAITYLALDTNIFISHLSTVKLLHDAISRRDDCARPSTLPEVRLLIPNTVIHELDRQKNRWNESCSSPSGKGTTSSMRIYTRSLNASRHAESSEQSGFARTSTQSLAVAARTAIEWLLKVRQTQRRARQDVASAMVFQKKEEALSYDAIAKADDRILDCCEYFQSQGMQPAAAIRRKVILWTDDKNLSLQAEIHDIACIGNRSYSVQQIFDSICSDADPQEFKPSSTQKAATISNTTAATSTTPTKLHVSNISHNSTAKKSLIHASHSQSHHRNRNRGIESSIWADRSPTSRKQKASSSILSAKIRATSIQTASITPSSPPNQSVHKNTIIKDAIDIINSQPPTPTRINNILGHLIAFPLFDLLLDHVCKGQPTLLRQFLGHDNPGPGHWNAQGCLELMAKGWDLGLHAVYAPVSVATSSIPSHIVQEAIIWLHGFFHHYTTTDSAFQQTIGMTQTTDWKRATQAIDIIFIRHTSGWWLNADLVHTIGLVISWIDQAEIP